LDRINNKKEEEIRLEGARAKIELERGKMRNIIKSFENWGKGLTIKGRKIISNSLR
jgi:hypothetical protein